LADAWIEMGDVMAREQWKRASLDRWLFFFSFCSSRRARGQRADLIVFCFVRDAVPRGQRADLIAALDRGDGRALDRVFDCNEPALKRLGEESVVGHIFFTSFKRFQIRMNI
jgi:hypothetical protein